MKSYIFLIVAFAGLATQASEIDQLSQRHLPLSDSREIVNQKANELALAAVNDLNARSRRCNESDLYKALKKPFDIILDDGQLVNFIFSEKSVDKHTISRKDSIYKYHGLTDGYLLARPMADKDGIGMGSVIQFGDYYIGTDKFEHMFGRGWEYYSRYYLQHEEIINVLQYEIGMERTLLGGNPLATGVFSYADLVANFNGMRFWNSILQKHEDFLGKNIGPYFKCENKKWVQVKQIDFTDFMDQGFDEGINCSNFITKNGFNGVMRSIRELQQKLNSDITCPAAPGEIHGLLEKYDIPLRSRLNGEAFKTRTGKVIKLKDYMINTWGLRQYKRWWYPMPTLSFGQQKPL